MPRGVLNIPTQDFYKLLPYGTHTCDILIAKRWALGVLKRHLYNVLDHFVGDALCTELVGAEMGSGQGVIYV